MTPSDFLSEPFDPARLGDLEAQDQDAIHAAHKPPASSTGAAAAGALSTGAAALGGLAVGALAVGAVAIGALAIGRLSIGHFSARGARIRRLEIDELIIHRVSERRR